MANLVLGIGTKVVKRSKKPFKSTNTVNTVKGYTDNPHTGKVSYTFVEDESSVECFRCREFHS